MKTIRKPYLKALALMLLAVALVSCRTAAPAVDPGAPTQPAQAASTPGSGDTGTTGQNGTGGPAVDAVPTIRPTTPAVPALSASLPAFDGLYWSSEVSVMPISDTAVRIVSGLPCPDLLDLLAAGEWLVAEQAVPPPAQSGMFSTLARLEKSGQAALIDLKGYVFMELEPVSGDESAPLPENAEIFPGCSGTVQVLSEQPVSAEGVEQAEGTAVQYPFMGGCTTIDGDTQVKLYYEGPGDFRASVDFTVPAEVGEYSGEESDVSLSIQRSEKSYVGVFAEVYALGAFDGEGVEDLEGTEYYPMGEDTGMVRVTSVNPLAGEIVLNDYANDYGESQSFTAGWTCP